MPLIVFYFVLIIAGSMNFVFEGSSLLSLFFSFSSLLASIQIIRSNKNILWTSLNNIFIPLTILLSVLICIFFIEIIKNSFDPSFLLKLIQVLSFCIPSFYVGSRLIFNKKLNLILDILMGLILLQYILILVPSVEKTGCLVCLSNYVYGMRVTAGLNLMCNAILFLSVLNLLIIKSLKLFPKFGLVNSYIKHSILLRKCFFYSLFYTFIVISIPSRQLLLSYFLAIIILFPSELKSLILNFISTLFGINKKIKPFTISISLAFLTLFIYMFVQFISTLILRFEKEWLLAENFIRVQQIVKGYEIFAENPFLGANNDLILENLSNINTIVFENSYVDLMARTGVIPILMISFLLFYFVKNSYDYKFNLNSRLILVFSFAAFFNEIIIQPVFWIPIFLSYGLEKSIMYSIKAKYNN